jgi:hypothetical protein
MTWPKLPWAEILKTGGPVLAIVLLSGMLARACGQARTATDEVARQREARDLLVGKFNVATQDAAVLKTEADKAKAAEKTLRDQVASLEKQVGKVKIVEVVRWKTIEVPATGTPVPLPPGGPACVLRLGDGLEGSVSQLQARTVAGNLVALGHLVVDRTTPTRATLLDQPFEAKLSSFVTESVAESKPRFSLGGGLWWTNPKWSAEIRGGLRLLGDLWVEGAGRFDNQYEAGVRWEFR